MLTIYKASAGSGKTFTLAFEYIKLLLGVRPEGSERYYLNSRAALTPLGMSPRRRAHSHILAITFTNKATAEMKSRIISELDALARIPEADAQGKVKDSEYARRLTALFSCSRADLAETASRALRELLYDYGSFNVSTIDSFFQTVLRAFAREIDHQGDYRIEIETKPVLAEAISMLFDDLNDSAHDIDTARVSHWLMSRSNARVSQGKDFNPFYRSGGMYSEIISSLERTFNERFAIQAARVQDYLADPRRMKAFADSLLEKIGTMTHEVSRLTETAIAEAGSGLNSYLAKFMEAIRSGEKSIEDASEAFQKCSSKYMKALNEGIDAECYTKTAKTTNYPALHSWYSAVRHRLVLIGTYSRMYEALDGLWALSYIDRYISRFRNENNLIILSDTNSLLRSIIADDETPFIYERVGQPLQNFLIDEFQDTSRMQWLNLKPLVGNSLASDRESLIIGDVKQSIYRWRGADSSLLDSGVEQQDFPGRNAVVGRAAGENTNYRSAHPVVRFNNTLFSRLAAMLDVPGYGGIEQSLADKTRALDAYITVTAVDPDDPGAILTPDQLAHLEAAGLEVNAENVALERLASEILAEHARGYHWSDIAILCRSHSEAAKAVNFILAYYPEIQIMSGEALLLANCASVKLIVSFMELLDKANAVGQPLSATEDIKDEPGAETTDPLIHSRTDAEILVDRFEYFISHGREPHQALAAAMDLTIDSPGTEQAASLTDDIEFIRRLAPYNLLSLVEAIIMRKLTPERRAADLPYITAFVDLVTDWSKTHIPTVHSFLNYWNQKSSKLSIAPGEGQDAVTVSTVHAAKGLEWDCVHLPLMTWKLEGSPDSQWFSLDELRDFDPDTVPPLLYLRPKLLDADAGAPLSTQILDQISADTADNLNVAYVAFTRAVRELHIHTFPTRNESGPLRTYLWEALEMPARPEEISGGEIYTDLQAMMPRAGEFTWGKPTSHVDSRKAAPTPHPAPPYAVSFSELARTVARLDDITTLDSALDPFIGNSPDDPLFAAVDSVEPDSPGVLVLARNRGLNLHAILARMMTLNDLDTALEAERGKLLQDEAGEDYYRQVIISAFRAHPEETGRWFAPDAPRVLMEQPIYLPERDQGFRPDRIVWTADGHIDIVDYKFTSTEHPEHITQVRGYVNLLRSMGHTGVRGYVWYPARRSIKPV